MHGLGYVVGFQLLFLTIAPGEKGCTLIGLQLDHGERPQAGMPEVACKKATHWPLCFGSYVALTGCIAAVIRL